MKKVFLLFNRSILLLPKDICSLFAFAFVFVLGYVDHLTGPEWSFSLFYIIPVSFTAWYCGRVKGIIISIEAAAVWMIADLLSGHVYSYLLIPVWNSLVRFGFFIIITFLLSVIRIKIENEEKLAGIDFLTGLWNSRAFYDKLKTEALRAERYHHPFSILYIDLDNFKSVNDSEGHDKGDEVLKKIARILNENIRKSDVGARLGGDEFAVLFIEAGQITGEMAAKNLIEGMAEFLKKEGSSVTLSAGLVTFLKPKRRAEEMIKMADNLMYSVKRKGKNGILHETYTGD